MKFSKEDIEIGNRLITDFMGVTITDFHDDWKWLMPVFHKIGKLYIDGFPINTYIGTDGIYIGINPTNASGQEYKGQCQIVETLNINYFELNEPYTPIEGVWLGIVNFLKWYNQHESL